MEVKRLLFKSSEIDLGYAASAEGIWGEENYFVPMKAIRMWIFHKDGKDGKWMAFSDNYEWIYVSHHADDFIKFLLEILPAVERFEVKGDKGCERSLLFLENEMSLNYSLKRISCWNSKMSNYHWEKLNTSFGFTIGPITFPWLEIKLTLIRLMTMKLKN